MDNTSQTKDNTGVILLGMSIAAVAIGIVLTANDSGSEDDVRLGTDRAAGEGEDERRIREREGGRSREAAEETREYRSWKTMSDSEMLAYYKEHYEGLSRRKLQDIDPSFYQTLRNRNLIDEIPTAYRDWVSMSDQELLAYYHEHYEGISRGKLCTIDRGFYGILRKRGLIDEIPTRMELWEQKFLAAEK
ncbi:MAG: hypothetical protein AAB439_00645 [Patescibacteria group bacterium]